MALIDCDMFLHYIIVAKNRLILAGHGQGHVIFILTADVFTTIDKIHLIMFLSDLSVWLNSCATHGTR